jgi:hypothetical protein
MELIYEPTALLLRADMEKDLKKLSEESQILCDMKIVDAKTYKQVHEQQMILRDKRIEIEKARKAFTELKQKEVKDAIQIEKDLIAIFSEKEEILKIKKQEYDEEKERIKQEEEAQKQAKITARIQALALYGIQYNTIDHGIMMSDVDFDAFISTKKVEFEEAEKIRLEQIENDRIAREKFEEDQKKLKEDQDRLEAEKQAIQAEKDKIEQDRINAENSEKRRKELTEATEKARLQGIEDEKIRKEKEELESKRIEKEEQEKLQKKKKYQEFLSSIWLSEENKSDFTFIDTDEGRVFYKKVWIYLK